MGMPERQLNIAHELEENDDLVTAVEYYEKAAEAYVETGKNKKAVNAYLDAQRLLEDLDKNDDAKAIAAKIAELKK